MENKQMEMMAQGNDQITATEDAVQETVQNKVSTYQKIENAVVGGYKKIENGVVSGYKKIETGAVEGFGKVVDKCVEVLFAKEGETVEQAKARLSGKEEK